MTQQGDRALMRLELQRCRSAMLLMIVGFLGLVLLALLAPPFRDAALAVRAVFPALAGLILGAGIVSEDTQQGTLIRILALPLSRARLWGVRALTRLTLLLGLLLIWEVLPRLMGLPGTRSWGIVVQEGPPSWLLLLSALLSFAAAFLTSNLTRSPFEAALLSWVLMPILMAVLQTPARKDLGWLYATAVVLVTLSAVDLVRQREPPASRALWVRGGGWIVVMVTLLALAARTSQVL